MSSGLRLRAIAAVRQAPVMVFSERALAASCESVRTRRVVTTLGVTSVEGQRDPDRARLIADRAVGKRIECFLKEVTAIHEKAHIIGEGGFAARKDFVGEASQTSQIPSPRPPT